MHNELRRLLDILAVSEGESLKVTEIHLIRQVIEPSEEIRISRTSGTGATVAALMHMQQYYPGLEYNFGVNGGLTSITSSKKELPS